MTHFDIRPWTARRHQLGEGLRWTARGLVFVDILPGVVGLLDPQRPGDMRMLHEFDRPVGCVAPVADHPDTWLAGLGTGIAVLTGDHRVEWLARPEDGASVPMRMNDGGCDPLGRFWVGSMSYDAVDGAGSLYRVDHDGTVTQVLDGITIPNGPAFTPDGATMYLADSARGRIDRYPVDPVTGSLSPGEPFVTVDHGSPDGMIVDDDGHLWVAVWGAAAVHRYTPTGDLALRLDLPSAQPTSVCFAGPDRRRLFISSATDGLTDVGGHDGRVLAVDTLYSAPSATPAVLDRHGRSSAAVNPSLPNSG